MILGVRASSMRAHGYTGASCLHERRGRPVAGAGVSPLGSALKGWGSWSLTCSLFSYQNKLSLARKLSVGSEQCWSGGRNNTVQAKCVICVWLFSGYFALLCAKPS